ncbi:MAG: IPT/TIG domain-containing protein [Leptospirales bacterium]|nr:IPT/TIG domain-containing protein [Leptospirales bacterium]
MRGLLLIAGLLLCTGLFAQQANPFMEWKPIQGAGGYIVQVRDAAGKVVLEKKVQENRVELELVPGRYEQRVAALNKFQKPMPFSDWKELSIRVQSPPDVKDLSTSSERVGEQVVTIEGKNFNENTKVFLDTDKGKVASSKVDFVNDHKIVASFDTQKIDPGKHDIVVENSRNRIVRVEDAFKMDANKKVAINDSARVIQENSAGKQERPLDQKTEPGKTEPGKTGDIEADRIYPPYEGGTSPPRYNWKMQTAAFVPGLVRIRSADRKGYTWPALLGGLVLGSVYENNKADKTVTAAEGSGLAPILSGPMVLGTTSLWTNSGFVTLATMEYQNQKKFRNTYRIHIRNRNILLGSAVLLYGFQIIDAALIDDTNGFFFAPKATIVGPVPGQRNLQNSDVSFKFSRDAWIPGKVRRSREDRVGTITLGVLAGLGAGFAYETYNANRIRRAAVRLKDAPLHQFLSSPLLPFSSSYWTNPAFIYPVVAESQDYKSLKRQYKKSQQLQGAYALAGALVYLVQVFDAAALQANSSLFAPAKLAPGTNPPPMPDMYCTSGGCMYAPASDFYFKPKGNAFVPGRARSQNGNNVTGNVILGAFIAASAGAAYEGYLTYKARRGAIRENSNGANVLFSNQFVVLAGSQYWTNPAYVTLFTDYYLKIRRYDRKFSRSSTAQNTLLGVAAGIYLAQFIDAATLGAGKTSLNEIKSPVASALESQGASLRIDSDLQREKIEFLAQEKITPVQKTGVLDVANFSYSQNL